MPITAPPGTRFQYCSRCIVLAAYVLERIAGQSWEAYTRIHIFEPLGMTTASFGALGLEQASDRARPYRHDAGSGDVPVPWGRLRYLGPLGPAGGIDANVDEMAHYALLEVSDGTIFGHQLVSAQMTAELHRPEIAVGDDWMPEARIKNLHYALGWFTADVHGTQLIFHFGGNPGYRAVIALVLSAKIGVVILTNGKSGHFTGEANAALYRAASSVATRVRLAISGDRFTDRGHRLFRSRLRGTTRRLLAVQRTAAYGALDSDCEGAQSLDQMRPNSC